MARSTNDIHKRRFFFGITVFLLCLAALLPYLMDMGYEPLSVEAGAAVLTALFFAVLIGPPMAGSLLLDGWISIAVYFVLDLYFFDSWIVPALIGASTFAVARGRYRENLHAAIPVFASFFCASVLLKPTERARSAENPVTPEAIHLPPIIHLVFDEYGAIESLNKGESASLPQRIRHDYLQRGFRLYPNTPSVSGATQISLSRMLTMSGDSYKGVNFHKSEEFDFVVRHNTYLDTLIRLGYQTTVIQSSFLKLCTPTTQRCITYSRGDNGASMSRFTDQIGPRLHLALKQFHVDMLSPDTVRSVGLYGFIAQHISEPVARQYWTRPAAMLDELDRLREDLSQAPLRGRAIVAHILLPHFPYMLSSECGLRPPEYWQEPAWRKADSSSPSDTEDIATAYWEQLGCLHKKSMDLVDAVRDRSDAQDALIIVHGDHGARIQKKTLWLNHDADLGPEDQESLYTFFAVKAPAFRTGEERTPASMQERFRLVLQEALPSAR